ncbi:hypothetical protein L1887_14628 [Cichorium endivia]|nr:hypothetical protein L1887_14628 [Cichorium endivia]
MEQILSDLGLSNCNWKFLGGLDVLLECSSKGEAEAIVSNKDHGIRDWLEDIRYWSADYVVRSRLTWIKLYGVPIDVWSGQTFHKIASLWGTVIKMENCEFSLASSLVAGKILIATCYEFPLENEVLVKLANISTLIKVKDEGWIDEVGDDSVASVDEDSLSSSDEEDDWDEDPTDSKSNYSVREEDAWEGDDQLFAQEEEGQPSLDVASSGAELKEKPKAVIEDNNACRVESKSNYDEGNHLAGKRNSFQKFKTHDGVCGIEESCRGTCENKLDGWAQEIVGDQGVIAADDASETEPFQPKRSSYPIQSEEPAVLGIQSSKIQNNHGSSLQEKDVNRNFNKWDGGMSMRLLNKMVRDRNRRRRLTNNKGKQSEKAFSCPKSITSSQTSKLRNPIDQMEGQNEGHSVEIQSLEKLGNQIGFRWNIGEREGDRVSGDVVGENGHT